MVKFRLSQSQKVVNFGLSQSSTEHEIISLWNPDDEQMSAYAIGVIDNKGYANFVSNGGGTSAQNPVTH